MDARAKPADPPPPENPELAAALAEAQDTGDPNAVHEVEDLLLASTLIAPVASAARRGRSDAVVAPPGEDGGLDLVAALRPAGGAALLAFTGLDPLLRWTDERPFIAVTAVALCGFVLERDLGSLWLDPAGPASVAISEPELRAIAAGRRPRDEQGSALAPERPPGLKPLIDPAQPALAAALSTALDGHPDVEAGHLLEGDAVLERRQLVVGLRMAPEGGCSFTRAAEDACAALAVTLPEQGWVVNAVAL